MNRIEDEMYEWWFASIKSLSSRKKRRLRTEFGNANYIYNIEETLLEKVEYISEKDRKVIIREIREVQIEKEYEKFREKQVLFIPYYHESYPKRLKDIPSPPYALYVKGKLPDEKKMSVAIVGARQCTAYGENMAIRFAEALAYEGVEIISGMARGIDGAGQRGALNVGGSSYAVLGSGVDVCYPREHIGLYMDLQKSGGIVSELPVGTQPLKENFPARNRIISGLSDVVLVIEAKPKSGSLITADMALEQGKDVYALPGPISSGLSKGCHGLIKQGAGILISPEDLLEELHLTNRIAQAAEERKEVKNKKVLETIELLVYSKLDLYPRSLECLLEETKLPPDVLMQQIVSMSIKGYIKEVSRNYYIRA